MERCAHIVVLAAGQGQRLASGKNKWLTLVGSSRLADLHCQAFNPKLVGLRPENVNWTVVTGFDADSVKRYVAPLLGERVNFVHNASFAEWNNWYSVLTALRAVERKPAEKTIVLNCDVFAPPYVLTDFLKAAIDSDKDNLIAVDKSRVLTDESMKVSTVRRGEWEVLKQVGKTSVEQPAGEYVGMFMVTNSTADRLRNRLELYESNPNYHNSWYEEAIGELAFSGVDWHIWGMPTSNWIEIDDPADLEAAKSLVFQ